MRRGFGVSCPRPKRVHHGGTETPRRAIRSTGPRKTSFLLSLGLVNAFCNSGVISTIKVSRRSKSPSPRPSPRVFMRAPRPERMKMGSRLALGSVSFQSRNVQGPMANKAPRVQVPRLVLPLVIAIWDFVGHWALAISWSPTSLFGAVVTVVALSTEDVRQGMFAGDVRQRMLGRGWRRVRVGL